MWIYQDQRSLQVPKHLTIRIVVQSQGGTSGKVSDNPGRSVFKVNIRSSSAMLFFTEGWLDWKSMLQHNRPVFPVEIQVLTFCVVSQQQGSADGKVCGYTKINARSTSSFFSEGCPLSVCRVGSAVKYVPMKMES
jgi:hypothetical protein